MTFSRSLFHLSRQVAASKQGLRYFASSRTRPSNRIYSSVRNEEEFSNLLLLSSSSRQALITLWTASWCRTCKTVAPLIEDLISSDQFTAADGSLLPPVGYARVEMDAPDMTEVVGRYQVRSIPLLLSFSRGEPQMTTSVNDARKLSDKQFLKEWLATEAKRAGEGGAGGSIFGKLFG